MVYNGLVSGRASFKFHIVDDAPKFYIHYRTSSNGGLTWSSWMDSAELDVAANPDGMVGFTWALTEGTIFQVYVIMTGPDKDESPYSNLVMGIVPVAPAQNPPYLEVYPVYRDGAMAAQLLSDAFPAAATDYYIWRRDAGQTEWMSVGYSDGRSAKDPLSEPNKSYEYVIAWYDRNTSKLISDFSNIATVTIPDNSSMVLLPPIRYEGRFLEQGGQYYNQLNLGAGDMRATKTVISCRLNGGSWYPDQVMEWSAASLESWARYITARYGDPPIAYDKWEYRLKNRADGYTDSEWSKMFEIVVPSLLPRLDTPSITLSRYGSGVLVGWSAISNAVGYKLERMRQGESSYTVIAASIPASYTSYHDNPVTVGYTYYYRLTALGDDQYYQDSLPDTKQITIPSTIVIPQPVIDSLVESNIDLQVTISNLDVPNTSQYRVEMSENNEAWRDLFGDYPSSMSVSTFTMTIAGKYIMQGGNIRVRVKVVPVQGAEAPDPYSEIATITIDEREWLLRWTGTTWDYCTSVTGGWYAPAWTDSDGTHYGNIATTDLGNGTLRIAGSGGSSGIGYWTTVSGLTTNTSLRAKYKRVCMIGTLVKQVAGQDNHAWFGTAWDYTFAGGFNMDTGRGTKVIAGSDSGQGAAGTKTDPYVTACGTYTYAPRSGSHVYFYFQNGYADVKGIYAIKA